MTEEMSSYKFACVVARFLDEKIAPTEKGLGSMAYPFSSSMA